MKYFTKEWYKAMQNGGLHIGLLVINKAETFSEEYFQKVYKGQEKHQIEFEKSWYEMCNTDKIYANYNGTTSKERLKWRNQILANDKDYKAFLDEQKIVFYENYKRILKDLEDNLPKEILSEIADIRLLALNRCTFKVKKLITKFCEENQKFVHESCEEYTKEHEKSFKNQNTEILRRLSFHDGEIYSCKIQGNDLIIRVSDIDGASETGYGDITFKNYKILSNDVKIEEAIWLYEEIYKVELGYELYVLLTKENSLIEFGVFAEDIYSTKQIYE